MWGARIVDGVLQDSEFPGLSGARIVRIATHPELASAGYGSAAVKLLKQYFEGELTGRTLTSVALSSASQCSFAVLPLLSAPRLGCLGAEK